MEVIVKKMEIRTYSELITIPTFEERYKYLKLDGIIGEETFGFERYLNQNFYRTREWKRVRNYVIERDNACDLAFEDMEIPNGIQIVIHHMNRMSINDILEGNEKLLDPEFLICTTKRTHNAIHYGDDSLLYTNPIERKPNDTCLWR